MPPRHALPAGVRVPVLPGLGVSWYDRRNGYWARRAGIALLWLFLTALIILITVAILIAIRHRSVAGFSVALGIEIAYSLGIPAYLATMAVRHWNDPAVAGRLFGGGDRGGRGGRGGSRLVRALTQVFVGFSFLSIGLYLTLLVIWMLPETPPERRARLFVACELHGSGHGLPNS
jgi:hypothetical protein